MTVDPGLAWLLSSSDPAVVNLARSDLLDERFDPALALRSARVQTLLKARPMGHPYGNKWKGAHWRLVALVELGVRGPEPDVHFALEQELAWIVDQQQRRPGPPPVIQGRERRHASMEGNALAVCCRLGLAGDSRAGRLRDVILRAQWPDGGWNCDLRPGASHSSFHETLATLWGLAEFVRATGDAEAGRAAERAAEFFLRHRLFRSERTGKVADPEWLRLHYPPYWHFDILQGLLVLSRMGLAREPRCAEALDVLESKRRQDGTWTASGVRYWRRNGHEPVNGDLVDWGDRGANEMLTLNALRVLKAAGRLLPGRPARAPR